MSTDNLDHVDLSAVVDGGTVHEDVMDMIYSIDPEDRPFLDAIGSGDSGNHYKEFVQEQLESPNPDNAAVDGADLTGQNDTVTGNRLGNYHQEMTKVVRASHRAREANTIGSSDELLRQLGRRQIALRRDEEAAMTSNNPAVPGNGDDTPGKLAGIGAWLTTNTDNGLTTGADPTLSATTGGYPNVGPVAGDIRAGSLAIVKSLTQGAYKEGGNCRMAMSTPDVIDKLSDFLFDATARVATLQTETPAGNQTMASSGNGNVSGGVVAQGSVNMLVTNFGTLNLVPNRFQPESSAGAADLFIIDPDTWEASYLQGYRTETLAKVGLADNRVISVDATLCGLAEYGNAAYRDINHALAFTA